MTTFELSNLKADVEAGIGKPEWKPMLAYTADLHGRSILPAREPLPYEWEEIGPGYCYGPAFGHWDLIHQVLDVLPSEPEHARKQLLNNLANQEEDGLLPGSIWMGDDVPSWDKTAGHPPVWPIGIMEYLTAAGDAEILGEAIEAIEKQIKWFEGVRQAEPTGFFYTDILNHKWESGIDEGIRFLDVKTGPFACVDATAHMYLVYVFAAAWMEILEQSGEEYKARAAALRDFMQNEMYDEETGFFYDIWAMRDPALRSGAFEGIFPMVMGAAAPEQAQRVIDDNLLNSDRFFTAHPIATVAASDPHFELRMWRGPAWNSMTFWAAKGCLAWGRADAAGQLLERALDCSAEQFDRTGTIWEFYHPHGGKPEDVVRKPDKKQNGPCPDYLGHNPLIAMARIWEEAQEEK